MNPIDEIAGLDTVRWERARSLAQQIVKSTVNKPDKSYYTGQTFSRFPRWVTALTLIVLGVIGVAAFWLSAGKQIAATDLVLMPIVRDYGTRLSPGWADIAILLMLLLSELGTILFSTASGIFPGQPTRIGRWHIRLSALAFRIAAFTCARFALLANITITALHTEDIAHLPLFGWFLAVAPPIVVVFIGLFAERLLLTSLEARAIAKEAYDRAYAEWERIQREPDSAPQYRRIWHMQILDQLMKVSPTNRRKLEALIHDQPQLRAELVRREFIRHEWADFTIEVTPARPTMPLAAGESYPSLTATSNGSPNGSEKLSEAQ
ncbi:MAG: hypothetical protein IT324_33265 [Anaerolineae bacterium]|nr:hypothetical protein [Anaerolineae bacterium]